MSSRARCGLSPHQREQFLRENGYEPAPGGTGKGSHVVWINHEMEELAKKRSLSMPANIRSNSNQSPCTVLLCSDPASGTWKTIEAQVKWCKESLEQEATKDLRQAGQDKQRQLFAENMRMICEWKQEVSWKRRGIINEARPAPMDAFKVVMEMRMGR